MNLDNIRKEIDEIDDRLLKLLAYRMVLAKQAGLIKKSRGKAIFDPEREEEILNKIIKKAQQFALSPEFAKDMHKLIINESKRIQGDDR